MQLLTPTTQPADGWVEHDTDRCPLEGGTLCEVRYRDGGTKVVRARWATPEWRNGEARFWVTADHHHSDIIAYRLLAPSERG